MRAKLLLLVLYGGVRSTDVTYDYDSENSSRGAQVDQPKPFTLLWWGEGIEVAERR